MPMAAIKLAYEAVAKAIGTYYAALCLDCVNRAYLVVSADGSVAFTAE